jgi:glycine/D-amino acid oxidase-like deaminating enzyme
MKRTRPIIALEEDARTTIAIVGGGISGVATAYFLLRDTNKSVTLLERDKVAHGATGHNGGQVVAALETPLEELSKNFSYDLILEGLKAINSAWDLLYSMVKETGIEVELKEVSAYLALSIDGARFMLGENQLRDRSGLPWADLFLAEDVAEDIPEEFRLLFRKIPRKKLEELLLTRDGRYGCALVGRSGLMNSAVFCEELVSKMLEKYPSRFRVYEDTPVQKIEMGKEAILRTPAHELKAQQVVLCTNGYTDLEINGVFVSLKCAIESVLGYMAGYLDEKDLRPTAIVYFSPGESDQPSGYFYLSTRKYAEGSNRALTCMGGPNKSLRKVGDHSRDEVQDENEYTRINEFYRMTIVDVPGDRRRDFSWKGLMGYTSDGLRLIGPDPANGSMIYNLGCNGIGILPSIYGGKRIARYINGEPLEPSIFDPRSVRASH